MMNKQYGILQEEVDRINYIDTNKDRLKEYENQGINPFVNILDDFYGKIVLLYFPIQLAFIVAYYFNNNYILFGTLMLNIIFFNFLYNVDMERRDVFHKIDKNYMLGCDIQNKAAARHGFIPKEFKLNNTTYKWVKVIKIQEYIYYAQKVFGYFVLNRIVDDVVLSLILILILYKVIGFFTSLYPESLYKLQREYNTLKYQICYYYAYLTDYDLKNQAKADYYNEVKSYFFYTEEELQERRNQGIIDKPRQASGLFGSLLNIEKHVDERQSEKAPETMYVIKNIEESNVIPFRKTKTNNESLISVEEREIDNIVDDVLNELQLRKRRKN